MTKTPFTKLPIYAAIRGCKLSRRVQKEVLLKLKKYYASRAADFLRPETSWRGGRLSICFNWAKTSEGFKYWCAMHRDSGL
jgi:hypothetical protein